MVGAILFSDTTVAHLDDIFTLRGIRNAGEMCWNWNNEMMS